MKKLTAGIFATILGLTAVDAFAVTTPTSVASTGYVKQAMQAAQTAAAGYTDTKTTGMATQTWVGDQGYLKSADLAGYAKTVDVATKEQGEKADAAAPQATTYTKTEVDAKLQAVDTSMDNLGNTYVAWSYVDDNFGDDNQQAQQ